MSEFNRSAEEVMHIERAFRVINLLDIPEAKRKFWPQKAAVIIRITDREILDVIQFFEKSFTESEKYSRLYPGSITFFNSAGDFKSVEELQAKIDWCFREKNSTYVLGHGLQKKADPVGTDNSGAAPRRV